jgi:hypothetical protein
VEVLHYIIDTPLAVPAYRRLGNKKSSKQTLEPQGDRAGSPHRSFFVDIFYILSSPATDLLP